MSSIETLRASFRPAIIATLFAGEPAPHNGTSFYDDDSTCSVTFSAPQHPS